MADESGGTFIKYVDKRFSAESLGLVDRANRVIDEYRKQGFGLTLRQLYYQFVSRDWIRNTEAEYKKLGSLVSDARLAGLVSWDSIEDRGRNLMGARTFDGPAHAVRAAREGYATDLWANQWVRPEVWIEKQALEGVIGGVCSELRVDFFATKGYNSQSEQWRAGRRLAGYFGRGQRPVVLHLGDHDPSGIDMTRDNEERLSMFAGVPVAVRRLALNWDQIERYAPPPNPTKVTDPRARGYADRFGGECWELDALRPDVIADLIRAAVDELRDESLWSEALAQEAADLDVLDGIVRRYSPPSTVRGDDR